MAENSIQKSKAVAVIVAHPDDETLWAGGTILNQSHWRCFIITLCRASDGDRAPRFYRALERLGADGKMGDLDDGPEQTPLAKSETEETILQLLPQTHFDLVISHSPMGEYTRHRRHEEIGRTVIRLWQEGKLFTNELWLFAYEDGGKQYLPQPIETAPVYYPLPEEIWQKKYSLITETYGFQENGFEAQSTPHAEAFWRFINSINAQHWLESQVFRHESSDLV
jgi:LmbE family N-acetylglucosaminyl deacetylase